MKKIFLILFVVMMFLTGCGIKGEFTENVSTDNPFIGTWVSNDIWSHYFNGSYQDCYEKYVFIQSSVSFYISTDGTNWNFQESYPCTYNGLRSGRFHNYGSSSCTFNGNTITKSNGNLIIGGHYYYK